MPTLKEPQKQIPGGFSFYEPSTKWTPAPFSSLDSITQQLLSHRQGQPYLAQKNGWPMDRETIYQEVVQWNVAKCVAMGWTDYLIGGAEQPAPFTPPTHPPRRVLRNVAGGLETLVEWISDGAEAVAPELANKRAATCAVCPKNKPGGWESFFTVPVSNAIRKALDKRKDYNLSTPSDDKLFVCEACLCPIPLKVHVPLVRILAKMSHVTIEELHESCWIRKQDS